VGARDVEDPDYAIELVDHGDVTVRRYGEIADASELQFRRTGIGANSEILCHGPSG
jgi:hypothetical protein